MSFVTLSDLNQAQRPQAISPEALQRHIDLLKQQGYEYRKQINQLQNNLSMDVPRNIPMTQARIDFLSQAVERIQRKVARLEHRRITQPVPANWTEGKLLSAEARGISGLPSMLSTVVNRLTGHSTGAGAFPALPATALADVDEDLVEMRSVVAPEYVDSVQEPLEQAFDSTVGIESGGEDMADPNDGGAELAFEGLTSGEASDGVAILEGLEQSDQADAGGQESFTNVPADMSLDDGGAISGDLVEPGQGQQPQDMVYQQREEEQVVRQGNQRISPALVNTSRLRQGQGAATMQPGRQPGVPGLGQRQGQIQRVPATRLERSRALLRMQRGGGVQSTDMGQLPDSAFNLATQLINTGAAVGTAAVGGQSGQGGVPAQVPSQQPTTLSRYMPLIVVGAAGLVATAAYFAFFRKKAEPAKAANPIKRKSNICPMGHVSSDPYNKGCPECNESSGLRRVMPKKSKKHKSKKGKR